MSSTTGMLIVSFVVSVLLLSSVAISCFVSITSVQYVAIFVDLFYSLLMWMDIVKILE